MYSERIGQYCVLLQQLEINSTNLSIRPTPIISDLEHRATSSLSRPHSQVRIISSVGSGPMVFREKLGGPMVLWTHGTTVCAGR